MNRSSFLSRRGTKATTRFEVGSAASARTRRTALTEVRLNGCDDGFLGGQQDDGGQARHQICEGDGERGGEILGADSQQEQQRRQHERRGDALRSVHRSPHAEIREEGKGNVMPAITHCHCAEIRQAAGHM